MVNKVKKGHHGPCKRSFSPCNTQKTPPFRLSQMGAVLTEFLSQGFYNPVTDRLIEPELTGISYSFTIEGWYEEAYYRAIPNRTLRYLAKWVFRPAHHSTATQPACPQGIMQWQHGTYSLPGNGSILLQPIGVDGRQLVSSPCSYDESVYTRYEQPELILV
jgi:Chaperone for protein-folding within the ER, fungal